MTLVGTEIHRDSINSIRDSGRRRLLDPVVTNLKDGKGSDDDQIQIYEVDNIIHNDFIWFFYFFNACASKKKDGRMPLELTKLF